jgi:predicted GNAT family acetyltransferase
MSRVVRVSGVYTPVEERGHGYASANVAAISARALDAGALACMLFADKANPTSNKIYQAIGYRPVGGSQEWLLDR